MKKYLNLMILSLFLLTLYACEYPPKPELKGKGPLAIDIDNKVIASPEFHNPLETWKAWHAVFTTENIYTQRSCMICHNPKTSCNNCHSYVGVKQVAAEPPDPTLLHGYNRLQGQILGKTNP